MKQLLVLEFKSKGLRKRQCGSLVSNIVVYDFCEFPYYKSLNIIIIKRGLSTVPIVILQEDKNLIILSLLRFHSVKTLF